MLFLRRRGVVEEPSLRRGSARALAGAARKGTVGLQNSGAPRSNIRVDRTGKDALGLDVSRFSAGASGPPRAQHASHRQLQQRVSPQARENQGCSIVTKASKSEKYPVQGSPS